MRPMILALLALALPAAAFDAPEGWRAVPSARGYEPTLEAVRDAVARAPIAVVTTASASDGAAMAGHDIPGNRVFGLFRNDYARRMLAASVAAGIEAPIRLYVTEDAGGAVTLSWIPPSLVWAPYMEEGGEDLRALAAELDAVFEAVAEDAAG